MDALWYARRLSRMGPREVGGRAVAAARARTWRRELGPTAARRPVVALGRVPRFTAALPPDALAGVPRAARVALLSEADRLMDGHATYFGVERDDMVAPDWSFDPKTGRRAPGDTYSFDVPYRDENAVGDVKQLWEPSRHQHLTVLAAAYALSGDDRYAHRVADHLKSWWAANSPMRGVHWVSGIELGIRLMSWVWVRRLLDGWPGAPALFEENADALMQIHAHQRWLAAFPSLGSSANNHVVAENAGQLAAACAFAWFPESAGWRTAALAALDRNLSLNTFASGLNRELATEYHGLVLELGLAAAVEAQLAGAAVPESMWDTLRRMTDALAAVVDARLNPPRQGDADDGLGLVVDGGETHRYASLLATGHALFGPLPWWPEVTVADVRTSLLASLCPPRPRTGDRPAQRPAHLPDAGLTILRVPASEAGEEIWCRTDAGPHGFGSIAAHAHADALSIEVRHGGIDVLADPGCYCYHGEPEWRSYFRSTLGHNTLELDGIDQSRSGGPFLWTRHATSRVLVADAAGGRWTGEHDGYTRRNCAVTHRRSVDLSAARRSIAVTDEVDTDRALPCRLAFHLGPAVSVELAGGDAFLSWSDGMPRHAVLTLPTELRWQCHRGEADPPRGWYSPGFGRREPAALLIGTGRIVQGGAPMRSVLAFDD